MSYNEKDDKSKTTDCGEFIPSYFTWQTLTGQKERAKELNNMTQKDEK